MCISMPYQFIDEVTSTVSVIPYVEQYENGRHSTYFSTITIEAADDIDYFGDHFTWVTHGRTLTWPTTYGSLQDFVGRAESTFDPSQTSTQGKDCDGTLSTSALELPSTIDPGSLIIPLAATSTTFKAGPLPQTVLDYLDSFSTVHEQLNNIPLTSCAPALPVRTSCTTVLTSVASNVSCDNEKVCVTSFETKVITNTHTPHWPTLNGSATDIKRTAAKLTTETAETRTIQATAQSALLPASEDSTDEPEEAATSEPAPESTAEDSPPANSISEPDAPSSQPQATGTEEPISPAATSSGLPSSPEQDGQATIDASSDSPGDASSGSPGEPLRPTSTDGQAGQPIPPSGTAASLPDESAGSDAGSQPTDSPQEEASSSTGVESFAGEGSMLFPSHWYLIVAGVLAEMVR